MRGGWGYLPFGAKRTGESSRPLMASVGAGSRGYRYLHHGVDDHSRVAYSEILDDQRKQTAARFWERANAFFATSA